MDSTSVKVTEEFFSPTGSLAESFPEHEERPGQTRMAASIAKVFQERGHLLVEAGTGIGKSFAYLAPALLQKKRDRPIVVSTGTIALQEQLLEKDIPQLAKTLKQPFKAVLAKGRGNYLCETRFTRAYAMRHTFAESGDDLKTLEQISRMVEAGEKVSLANLPGPLSGEAWQHIRSETGLCGGGTCRSRPCSFFAARLELKTADLIVINHSLLFVHLSLAQGGVYLIPKFDQLILDEAHHCPDIATEQFGIEISNTRVKFYLDQLYSRKGRGFLARVKPQPMVLIGKVRELRDTYESFFSELRMWKLSEGPENGRLRYKVEFIDRLSQPLLELGDLLENWAGTSNTQEEEAEFRHYCDRARAMANEIKIFLEHSQKDAAYWIEIGSEYQGRQKVQAKLAPIDVSTQLKHIVFDSLDNVVMTSATLTTTSRQPFEYFSKRMGYEEGESLSISSPFDYLSRSRVVISRTFPDPTENDYHERLPGAVKKCINATKGGAFVLVTSYAILRELHNALEPFCADNGYLLLSQGLSGKRSEILNRFRMNSNAVLIGNHSFWEGVDVPGVNLRNVIIPRLPFEVPDHPLAQTRYESIQSRGGNPFRELALPMAIMRFRQGFGRLMRRHDDMGLIHVLDSRLQSKAYGDEFLKSLPECHLLVDKKPDAEFMQRLLDWAKLD